jgi:hypothetical protein
MPLLVLRHARARRLRLRYDAAADTLRLTMPPRASLRSALAWAAEQQDWILSQRTRAPDLVQIADGAIIPIEGQPVRIMWAVDAPRAPLLDGDVLCVGGPPERAGERVLRWLKLRAKDVLSHETHALAGRHGFPLRSVGIGDTRSRWGSCAANGVIRYSWRLILAPAPVRLATVAHEVAHLVHMNHGPAFHALVAQISASDPDAARAWLRREGAGLHRYTV